jgi:hypothetical protein
LTQLVRDQILDEAMIFTFRKHRIVNRPDKKTGR